MNLLHPALLSKVGIIDHLIARRGAGARREKIQKIVCLGFYSRGFASFAGNHRKPFRLPLRGGAKRGLDMGIHTAHIGCVKLEFDPAKEAANLAKHGVDFSTVLRVFEDPDSSMINHREHREHREHGEHGEP